MPYTWVGNEAEAPPRGSTWPEADILDLTPANPDDGLLHAPPGAPLGMAVCAHCESVVSQDQAVVKGGLIENEPRFDNRPVIEHYCKQARGVVYLYAD